MIFTSSCLEMFTSWSLTCWALLSLASICCSKSEWYWDLKSLSAWYRIAFWILFWTPSFSWNLNAIFSKSLAKQKCNFFGTLCICHLWWVQIRLDNLRILTCAEAWYYFDLDRSLEISGHRQELDNTRTWTGAWQYQDLDWSLTISGFGLELDIN